MKLNLQKVLVLLCACSLFLSGCASYVTTKLPASYKGQKIEAAVFIANKNDVILSTSEPAPITNTVGPIDALAKGIIQGVANESKNSSPAIEFRRNRKKAINASLANYNFEANVNAPTINTLKSISWIGVESYHSSQKSMAELEKITKSNHIIFISYFYSIDEGQRFNNNLSISIYKKGVQQPIYRADIYANYRNKGELFGDNNRWEAEDGKTLKKAISLTTIEINKELAALLKNASN